MKFPTSYKAPKNLLSTKNSKTIKGEKLGYTTYIMYLAPHTQNSKGKNLCSHASVGCAKACLFNSGAARFNQVQLGKMNKTEYFLADRKAFLNQLVNELTKIEKLHKAVVGDEQIGRTGKVVRYKKFAVRLNGTSDIPFENIKIVDNKNIFELFPNVQFYDYTKNPKRVVNNKYKNYHLTFSKSENNMEDCLDLLEKGYNIAMVFNKVPKTYLANLVIDGDEDDLRFLDRKNSIVGLKAKGDAKKDKSGFVI